jgi:hypothetical protein
VVGFVRVAGLRHRGKLVRVNVHTIWRSLVKTSLKLQSCPLFHINRQPKNPIGLLPLVKSFNLKEETRLQLQRRFYMTAPIWDLRQIGHIYPTDTSEPVDGNGDQNMVTVHDPIRVRTSDLSIAGPRAYQLI